MAKTLETKLAEMIPTSWKTMDITAFELTHDGEGWSVNTPFNIGRSLDREEALQRLRSRWEIFKANYDARARVQDIADTSCEENVCILEAGQIPFADVRAVD